jgi:SulP family sulfate permease
MEKIMNYNFFIDRLIEYLPIVKTLKTYKKAYLKSDVTAALTVAIISIPQSMAYAIIAGLDPVYGLYTAIVSTIMCALFGNSEHLIGGPTNAISLLVASGMKNFAGAENFYELLFLMTFVVGLMQILFGVLKLGRVINYVSHAVIVGFTAGAGVLIALGQLNSLMGISLKGSYASPVLKVVAVFQNLGETNLYAFMLGLVTIAVIVICRKINKNLPGSLFAMILSIILAMLFSVDRYGVKLTGDIPATLPPFQWIPLSYQSFRQVLPGAVPIAIIGLVEAMSIAKSIASTSGQKLDANREFIGQGIANSVTALFHGYPGSGSFTRSAVNYYSGAKTRLSGVMSGAAVAVIVLFFAPYAKYIPKSSLAGVIMVIAYNMVNRKEMKKVAKSDRSDALVMWITFAATVLMPDLDWAIYMGIIISIVLYLKDTNTVPVKILVPSMENSGHFQEQEISYLKEGTEVVIVQIEGNLYFGSASDLENKLDSLVGKTKVIILRMKTVVTVDVTAMESIRTFIRRVRKAGGTVLVCGIDEGLSGMMIRSGLSEDVGEENIFMSEKEIFGSSNRALERAAQIIKQEKQ